MSKQSDGNQPGAPKSAPDRRIDLSKVARQRGEDGKTVTQNWLDIAARMRTPELAEGQESMVSQVRRHAREAENQPGQQDLIAKLLTTRFAEPQRRAEANPQRRSEPQQKDLSGIKKLLDRIAEPKDPGQGRG